MGDERRTVFRQELGEHPTLAKTGCGWRSGGLETFGAPVVVSFQLIKVSPHRKNRTQPTAPTMRPNRRPDRRHLCLQR